MYLWNLNLHDASPGAISIWPPCPVPILQVLSPHQTGVISGYIKVLPLSEIHVHVLS